jgi:lysophospholipase L1-like esterase
MLPWTGKCWSAEEQGLVAEQDRIGGRWQRILEAVLDDEHHQWFSAGLGQACEQAGVCFLDLSPALRQDGRWLFVDRVHMNDDGQDLLAQALVRELTPAREVAYS